MWGGKTRHTWAVIPMQSDRAWTTVAARGWWRWWGDGQPGGWAGGWCSAGRMVSRKDGQQVTPITTEPLGLKFRHQFKKTSREIRTRNQGRKRLMYDSPASAANGAKVCAAFGSRDWGLPVTHVNEQPVVTLLLSNRVSSPTAQEVRPGKKEYYCL